MAAKYLVTSALPYVNNVPHLGNIIGCVLSADVFVRYLRQKNEEVIYICGTDEHGTATENKAIEEGVTPKEICDKYFAIHKKVYDWFNCSFDYFGRTTSPKHIEITQMLFKQCDENGYILEDELEQLFCKKCDRFLADRFVYGKCPHCDYDGAKGDQCENCGKLLNATELIDPKCKLDDTKPEIRRSKHLFMDLEKLSPKLKEWSDAQGINGFWPNNAKTFTKAWFKEGLKPRCITRDLKWGIPVPKKGFEDKVFYVWFDAPIGYFTFTTEFKGDWKDWWTKDANVLLYQFMAKDNIPFHTILFPAILMGASDEYNLLHHISSTEYLNYENSQFSKSKGTGVFGNDAMDTGIPSDIWRYYLLINRPENSDSQFTWEDFQDKSNNELLANFGNFVNRALVFTKKFFDSKIPKSNETDNDCAFQKEVKKYYDEYISFMDQVKIKDSLKTIMHISRMGNQYFQENEPWKLVKEDMDRCAAVINLCDDLVRVLAIMVEPFLPTTSKEIFKQLSIAPQNFSQIEDSLKEGHVIDLPEPLFRKLEDSEILSFKEKYGGKKDKFAKIELRVGKVLEAEMVKDSDKLIKMQIDFGNEKRQVLSGIKKWYKPEELVGKNIINVHNLKPAKLAGEMSHGMVLSCEHNGKLEVLEAKKSGPGDRVYVEEFKDAKAPKIIDYKDFSKVELKTKNGQVFADDKELKTDSENIKLSVLKEGIVK